jgi:ribosomal protein S18 acetylase RimI-like enzyme
MIEVRRLRPDDLALLRDVRLRALRDAPEAFATRLAEAAAWPAERWEEIARQFNAVALEGERGVGMVSAWPLENGNVWLARMWVAPEARGAGVGLRLIDAVMEWARERGAAAVELSVIADNRAAAALYERAGFTETGRRRPLPADPSRTEVFLSSPARPRGR